MDRYAEVIIDLISDAVDRPFHYRIPPELIGRIKPGAVVRVPFGHRSYHGYVLRLLKEPGVETVRDLSALVTAEPLLSKEQLALASWLAHRYHCRRIEAIHAMVPAVCRQGRKVGAVEVLPPLPPPAADLSRAPRSGGLDLPRARGSSSRNAPRRGAI